MFWTPNTHFSWEEIKQPFLNTTMLDLFKLTTKLNLHDISFKTFS